MSGGVGQLVMNGPLILAVPVAAVAGAITFASPCCLPLIPGYLSYVAGMSGAGAERRGAGDLSPADGDCEEAEDRMAGERPRACAVAATITRAGAAGAPAVIPAAADVRAEPAVRVIVVAEAVTRRGTLACSPPAGGDTASASGPPTSAPDMPVT